MTIQAELDAGAAALEAYAEGQSFMARFAPEGAWTDGASDMIAAADAATDQSPAGRQAAAMTRLQADIAAAGYASMMSAQQCHDAAAVVL
ncbi:MAG: hypothetical protein KGL35_25370, partial [Bradyrhizobium sp.]|nr:hypothetical protein [Bradyrhizobium sp.]